MDTQMQKLIDEYRRARLFQIVKETCGDDHITTGNAVDELEEDFYPGLSFREIVYIALGLSPAE